MNSFLNARQCTLMVIFLIILLSVYPAFLMNNAKQNILFLGVMALSPLLIVVSQRVMPKFDIPLLCIYLLILALPMVFYPTSIRWSTLLYTGMFISFFLMYLRLLYSSEFTALQLKDVLKWLFYLYAITLVIQLGCFFLGLPILNRINVDLTHGFPRINALGPEPAWTARIECLFMFIYCCLVDHLKGYKVSISELFKEERWVCISFVFVLIACGSTTGLLFGGVLLCRFMNFRSIIYMVMLLMTVFYIGDKLEINSFTRLGKFIPAVWVMDIESMVKADGSGASRIIPTIVAFKQITLSTLEGWIGHGVDADVGIYKLGTIKTNGGAVSLWYNYGFIVQILYWAYLIWICHIKGEWTSLAICFLYVFGGITLNLQIMWFMLVMFCTYKYVISFDKQT